jgi:O-antigen/teichoic acid export membrane protein
MPIPDTNNHLIKLGFYNGLQKLLIPLFGILSTMLLAKTVLSKGDMGVWSLFLVITSFVELFRQALVKTALIKFINSSHQEDHKKVLTAAFFLNAVITGILCLVFFFASPYIAAVLKAPELRHMLRVFSVGMIFLIPYSHFEWIMYGKTIFKGLFYTSLWRQGLTLLIICMHYLVFRNISLLQLVVYYCTGIFIGAITGYYYVKHLVRFKVDLSLQWIKYLWHFGKYVFGSGLSTLIFRNADQFMVSSMLANTSFVASQSISLRIINLADIPSQVLGDILFPKSAGINSDENPGLIKYYYEKAVGASLSFILPILIVILVFPKLIIFFLAGNGYYDAIPYLRTIAISTVFLAFLKQYGVIIDASGKPRVNLITITIIAFLHVVFLWLMIGFFGFIGAGYALLCSHLAGFIITQAVLKNKFGISWVNCLKRAFLFYPEMYRLFITRFLTVRKWK